MEQKGIISVRMSYFLIDTIKHVAEKKGVNMSDLVNEIILNSLEKYKELTPLDKQLIQAKNKECIADKYKYLRSKSAERLNFMKNIRKQMIHFNSKDKNQIINNLNLSLKIAKVNKWNTESNYLKELILKIKNNEKMIIFDSAEPVIEYKKKFRGKNE